MATSHIQNARAALATGTNELELLFEISQALDRSIDLRDVVKPLLKVLAAHLDIMRGALTLLNRETGEICIDESYGLSAIQHSRGKYRLGEGVTGHVVKTGQPMIVPCIATEPMFLNRTGARAGRSGSDFRHQHVDGVPPTR